MQIIIYITKQLYLPMHHTGGVQPVSISTSVPVVAEMPRKRHKHLYHCPWYQNYRIDYHNRSFRSKL